MDCAKILRQLRFIEIYKILEEYLEYKTMTGSANQIILVFAHLT